MINLGKNIHLPIAWMLNTEKKKMMLPSLDDRQKTLKVPEQGQKCQGSNCPLRLHFNLTSCVALEVMSPPPNLSQPQSDTNKAVLGHMVCKTSDRLCMTVVTGKSVIATGWQREDLNVLLSSSGSGSQMVYCTTLGTF